jgi:hypothetical protein
MTPLVFPNSKKSKQRLLEYEIYNVNKIIGICLSLLNISNSLDSTVDHIRGFLTNGHEWSLFEVHKNYVKRTNFFLPKYKGKDKYYEAKFYDDINHIKAILGLIRYALCNFFIYFLYT